jgi:flagellar protein FlaG
VNVVKVLDVQTPRQQVQPVQTVKGNNTKEIGNDNKKDSQFFQEQQGIGENALANNDYLRKTIERANKVIFGEDRHFEFKLHEESNEVIVRLVDNETGEVLREIPPEKLIEMVERIWELVGIIVDKKA